MGWTVSIWGLSEGDAARDAELVAVSKLKAAVDGLRGLVEEAVFEGEVLGKVDLEVAWSYSPSPPS